MNIIVDMMGGDNAPLAVLEGAAQAVKEYGVQLIGQAVMHYRPMGRDRLRLPTPETEAAAGFYREFGFSPAADGPAWEKFIGYDPEFLGT